MTVSNIAVLPQNHADLTVDLAVFDSVQATTPTKQGRVRWHDAVGSLVDPKEQRKKKADLSLFKLATFSGGRNNENVKAISGVVVDYDAGEVPVSQAVDLLRIFDVEAVAYTTPSSAPGNERWRVVVPLSKSYGPEQHARFVGLLNAVLGGILAPESWTLSQIYYVGRVEGVPYDAVHIPGALLDVLDGAKLLPDPIGKPGATATNDAVKNEQPVDDPFARMERERVLAGVTDDTMADLASAVDYLAAKTDRFEEYGPWIEAGEALASLKGTEHEAAACDLWHRGSATDPRYDQQQAQDKWDSFRPSRITHKSIFEWATQAGWVNPKSAVATSYENLVDHTDAGNANLLKQLTAGKLRYVVERGEWLYWDGSKWIPDAHASYAYEQALRVSENYLAKARQLESVDPGDDAERKRIKRRAEALREWARACRNKQRVTSMLDFLSKLPGVAISLKDLDQNPRLLGVLNGVVDLKTGELRPDAQDDLVTRRCPVAYNPLARAPQWQKFIAEICGTPIPAELDTDGNVIAGTVGRFTPRPDLAKYVQRAFGYITTGLTEEHKMFFFHGPGSNGKNVLTDVVQHLLGSYACPIPTESLMASQYSSDGDKSSPTLARLVGIRAAFCSETRRGQKLDTSVLKKHTGDLFLSARPLYGHTFEFQKTHRLLMIANYMPLFDHEDSAVLGRIHRVELLRRFNRPDDMARDPALPDGDKGLVARLIAEESEGILAWLVHGARDYMRDGLCAPIEVRNATLAYFAEQGPVAKWLTGWQRCNPKEGTKGSELFEDYNRGGGHAISQTAFGRELAALGIAKASLESGNYYGLCRAGAFS